MEISNTPDIRKYPSGDTRTYWKPKSVEFEVIQTVLPPKCKGDIHLHRRYREATLVTKGEVVVVEYLGKKQLKKKLKAGEMVVFASGRCHTTMNVNSLTATTFTFKFIGGRKRKDTHFRNDKYVCSHHHSAR